MAQDAVGRGGDASAAQLTLIQREVATRKDVGADVRATVMSAIAKDFPLPAELLQERQIVANIARTLEGIESAWSEVVMPNLHTDKSDRVAPLRERGHAARAAHREARGGRPSENGSAGCRSRSRAFRRPITPTPRNRGQNEKEQSCPIPTTPVPSTRSASAKRSRARA
jgi:hypothetical protein